MRWSIDHGDCLEVLRDVADNSLDACVTDPPYELGFMGKKWDGSGVAFQVATWAEILRVLKPGAHLLAFGGTRTYHRMVCAIEDAGFEVHDSIHWMYGNGMPKGKAALKPGHEPIVLARKRGVGAPLRIGDSKLPESGRWPANVILDEDAAAELDEQAGKRRSAGNYPSSSVNRGDASTSFQPTQGRLYADSGGASRFFYTTKASARERNAGCAVGNDHPTVKPVALMRHLVRLVTPKNGAILDPFCGSGTTGVAALLEGLRFAGIEQSAEYVEIARQRIANAEIERAA